MVMEDNDITCEECELQYQVVYKNDYLAMNMKDYPN